MSKLKLNLSIIFILIYVFSADLGSILSATIGISYFGQILLLFIYSTFLFVYTRKHNLSEIIGLSKIHLYDMKNNLLYIPLVLMVLANGVFFFDKTISISDVILTMTFMILVAFLEELLFRGFLFKAIEKKGTTKTAIIISGATFGFGHIVNLFHGYTGVNQIIQIVLAILIGIVLSVLFIRTKSIVPGIIFHFAFNTASSLSSKVVPLYDYISVGIIVLISTMYLMYLLYFKRS